MLTENRNQAAEQVLRETLVADRKNAMAYNLLGNLLSEFGRFDQARACFETRDRDRAALGRVLLRSGPVSPRHETKPDSEDPDTVNHLNWYMSGFTRPYPGEKTVRLPSEFNNRAPAGEDSDDYNTFRSPRPSPR